MDLLEEAEAGCVKHKVRCVSVAGYSSAAEILLRMLCTLQCAGGTNGWSAWSSTLRCGRAITDYPTAAARIPSSSIYLTYHVEASSTSVEASQPVDAAASYY